MCILVLPGCGDKLRDRKHPMLMTQADVNHYLSVVTESPSADDRRKAVQRLSESKHLGEPHVVDTLAEVAANDESSPVRSAALLALDTSQSPVACETALNLLTEGDADRLTQEDPNNKAAALKTIRNCIDDERVLPDQMASSIKVASQIVEEERSRHVRLEAVRMLGCFSQRESLDILVLALNQRDFGICYEAEKSLHRLTGESFDCDEGDWKKFIAGVPDPFINGSNEPEPTPPPKRKWYEWKK